MPTYEFECKCCGQIREHYFRIADCPDKIKCEDCVDEAVKIISRSAIQCDSEADVKWLKSAEAVIRPEHEKPWSSRKDYMECLNRNNLCPAG